MAQVTLRLTFGQTTVVRDLLADEHAKKQIEYDGLRPVQRGSADGRMLLARIDMLGSILGEFS